MARRNKKGSKFSKLIIVAIVGIAGYNIFTSNNPSTKSSPNRIDNISNESPGMSSVKTYALQAMVDTWPKIQSTSNSIVPYSDKKRLLAKNYYIVLDASGSMKESRCADGKTKMQASIDALEQFLESAPKDANYGLSLFHQSRFRELVKLSPSTNWKQVMQELRSKLKPSGGTPLASATVAAQKKLEEQGKKQLGYGEYNLVLITDGIADPDQNPSNAVQLILKSSPVNLSVIGFCISERNVLNQPGYIQYRTATDPNSLKQSLQDVLAELPDFNVSDFNK